MIGYHSLTENKDLSGEFWPLGKSCHLINLILASQPINHEIMWGNEHLQF